VNSLVADITRRRRSCPRCEGRFTTYERVEEVMPMIIKKDGRREAYNPEKLLGGLEKATQKRPVQRSQIETIVSRIEKRLQSLGLKEVPAKIVGEMVMKELKSLDQVSYVRFASVYREFRDLDEFVAELKEEHDPVLEAASQQPTFEFEEGTPTT
jgi:transcriptional repressor NrdR